MKILKITFVFIFFVIVIGCKHKDNFIQADGVVEAQCALEKYSSWYCKDYNEKDLVTWYGDVFPFLNSNVPGAIFRCTTCHTEYGDYDYLQQRPELIKRMMLAMRFNEARRIMPRSGDYVPQKYIRMFEMFLENPVEGDKNNAPVINRWPDEVKNDDS